MVLNYSILGRRALSLLNLKFANIAWQLSNASLDVPCNKLNLTYYYYPHRYPRLCRRQLTDVDPSIYRALYIRQQMKDALDADILFAYVGILTTATVSIYAGAIGNLPVSLLSVDRASLFNWSSSLGMMRRSQRIARMRTRTMFPSLN